MPRVDTANSILDMGGKMRVDKNKKRMHSSGKTTNQAKSDLTLFAVPKAFKGHIGIIQKNAIRSWCMLDPRPEIVLIGSDEGTGETAIELGVKHIPDVDCNEYGTPLINSIFEKAEKISQTKYLAYINCDNILLDEFSMTLSELDGNLEKMGIDRFLLSSQRCEVDLKSPLNFESKDWQAMLQSESAKNRVKDSRWAIEIFLFNKGLFKNIPAFAVGRPGWDAWMVWEAKRCGAAIIDASDAFSVLHQIHDYNHIPGGWTQAWWGAEAVENQVLVQEQKMSLADATHTLSKGRLEKGAHQERMTAEGLVDIRLARGIEQLNNGEYKSALDYFENARLRKGRMRKPLINLGRAVCLMKLEKYEAACAAVMEEIDLQISEKEDKLSTSSYSKGLEYHRDGLTLLEKAKKIYRSVIASERAPDGHRAWAHLKYGELLLSEKENASARRHFHSAVELMPDNSKARIYLTQPEERLNVYLTPNQCPPVNRYICIQMDIYDPDQWEYYFKRRRADNAFIRIDADVSENEISTLAEMIAQYVSPDGHIAFGFDCLRKENGASSRWQVVSDSPDSFAPVFGEVPIGFGTPDTPSQWAVIYRLAKRMFEQDRLTIAQKLFEQVITSDRATRRHAAQAYLYLGKIKVVENAANEAADYFKAATDLDPENTEAKLHLAPEDQPLKICVSGKKIHCGVEYLNIVMDILDETCWAKYFSIRKIDILLLLLRENIEEEDIRFLTGMIRRYVKVDGKLIFGFVDTAVPDFPTSELTESVVIGENVDRIKEKQAVALLTLARSFVQINMPGRGEKIIKGFIDSNNLSSKLVAMAHVELGEIYLASGATDKANRQFRKASRLDAQLKKALILDQTAPNPTNVHISVSNSWHLEGFYNIRINPFDPSGWAHYFSHRKIEHALIGVSSSIRVEEIQKLLILIRNYCCENSPVCFLFEEEPTIDGIPLIVSDDPNRIDTSPPLSVAKDIGSLSKQQISLFYRIGLEMHKAGMSKRAEGIYTQLINNTIQSQEIAAWANFKYGEMLYYGGSKEKARIYFSRTVELKPDHQKAQIYQMPNDQPLNVVVSNSLIHGISPAFIWFNTDILKTELIEYYFSNRRIDTIYIDMFARETADQNLCRGLYEATSDDGKLILLYPAKFDKSERNKFILNLRGTGFTAFERDRSVIAVKTRNPLSESCLRGLWELVDDIDYVKKLPVNENAVRVGE